MKDGNEVFFLVTKDLPIAPGIRNVIDNVRLETYKDSRDELDPGTLFKAFVMSPYFCIEGILAPDTSTGGQETTLTLRFAIAAEIESGIAGVPPTTGWPQFGPAHSVTAAEQVESGIA